MFKLTDDEFAEFKKLWELHGFEPKSDAELYASAQKLLRLMKILVTPDQKDLNDSSNKFPLRDASGKSSLESVDL